MKIVLALGGNALQLDTKDASVESQLKACKKTAKSIVDLIEEGNTVAIVHGNGPQVGQILSSVEAGHKANGTNVLFPFDVCGSFSQGYIGYHLQNAISEELKKRNINKSVGAIITQVVVDKNDPAFQSPTKPIGSFYTSEDAALLSKAEGYIMMEDAGRGYRRVVASPKPLDIVEKDLIKDLVNAGIVVISCGGGGIPVVKEGLEYKGVAAVIDKDFAAEKLAEILEADLLLILTAVDKVAINYNKPNQEKIDVMTLEDVEKYIEQKQFAPGSMLPKMEACKKFIMNNPKKAAIIASLEFAKEALVGTSGTRIIFK